MHKKVYSPPEAELISYQLKDVLAISIPTPTEEYVIPIFTPEDDFDGLTGNDNP